MNVHASVLVAVIACARLQFCGCTLDTLQLRLDPVLVQVWDSARDLK